MPESDRGPVFWDTVYVGVIMFYELPQWACYAIIIIQCRHRKGYPHSMMICAYLRMKLSSLKMKRDLALVWFMPGSCSRVVRLAAPPNESVPAPVPGARPPPPVKSSPSSLSADSCAVILHSQPHSTLYTVHSTLHTPHSTLYTLVLYTSQRRCTHYALVYNYDLTSIWRPFDQWRRSVVKSGGQGQSGQVIKLFQITSMISKRSTI